MEVPATERFSTRVDTYRRYRPRYPAAIIDLLTRDCGLTRATLVADIAAGTGLLSESFLQNGNAVIAIEPNGPMRSVCESLIEQYPKLECRDGTAEATGLPSRSVDMVSVGQAMHWFDLPLARAEFVRILRPNGWCVVVYNNRPTCGTDFYVAYEQLLKDFGIDYTIVCGRYLDHERLGGFFAPARMRQARLPNVQELELGGLTGRLLSSSYMPQPGHPRYPMMLREIEKLFETHQRDGSVRIEYDCVVSYAQLT